MPARSIDTATISFGLVSIPVKVFSTSEPGEEIHFHLIHAGCGERLHQEYVCPKHGKVERADMSKGFELTKGAVIELDKAELEALDAVASAEIAIREFVPASAVDPIYIERTYYLAPDKGGGRAYRLLRDAIEEAELVGIASYAARGKQYVVMLRPHDDGFALHQLRYPDEIKPWSQVLMEKLPKPAAAELAMAGKIIAELTHSAFDATAYKDEVKGRVRALIADKAKHGAIEVPEPATAAATQPADLMAALVASLGGGAKKAMAATKTDGKKDGRKGAHRPTQAAAKKPAHTARVAKGTRRTSRAHA